MIVTLNIGSKRSHKDGFRPILSGKVRDLTLTDVVYGMATCPIELDHAVESVVRHVIPGQDEWTYAVRIHAPGAHIWTVLDWVWELSRSLRQDCIAVRSPHGDQLVGPHAADWLPFNPDYFVE